MRSKLLLSLGLLSCAATSYGQNAVTPATFNKEKFLQKVTALRHAAEAAQIGGKTTGTGQRLIAASYYDFSNAQLVDSMRLKYSGTRGSAFDFDQLTYNLDFYYPALGPAIFVAYDTTMTYDPPTSSSSYVSGSMKYNAAGKPSQTAYYYPGGGGRTDYTIDAQNRYTKANSLDFDGTSWDSSYRTFYFYDAQSRLVKDSSESWDGSAWMPDVVTRYTNNAAGFPTKAEVAFDLGMGYQTVFELNLTYAANNKPTKLLFRVLGSSMTLEDNSKDSMAYNGAMLVSRDSYNWDDVTSSWVKYQDERRRLNSAGLPDSVVTNDIDQSGITTTVQKLVYNSAGLPTYQRNFYNMPPVNADDEQRYYYQNYDLGVHGKTVAGAVGLYPNPARAEIRVKPFDGVRGTLRYAIINAAGQTLQLTTVNNTSEQTLSVSALPAGNYFLVVSDDAGQRASTTFVKQ